VNNYDNDAYSGRAFARRFPDWVEGRHLLNLSEPFDSLKSRVRKIPVLSQPRLFISHKQADRALALRAAQWAQQAGFLYWLDVLDPALSLATKAENARAIAAAIEVALLNCSHLVAVMTNETKKSRWVPYEYGRVKGPLVLATKLAAWKTSGLADELPEYCYLAQVHSDDQVLPWLEHEADVSSAHGNDAVAHRRALY
jgi:hypothetical protein